MMIVFMFVFLYQPELLRTVPLETGKQPIFNIKSYALATFSDGSFLITTKYTVYHFDRSGHQIVKIGSKGQGPGEFQHIKSATWTGAHYVVSDARTLTTSIFDEKGAYQVRKKVYYDTLATNDFGTFYNMGESIDQFKGERPLMVGELEILDKDIKELPPRFHQLSSEAVDLFYNYGFHFVAATSQSIFVIDEVKPELFIYDFSSKKKDRSIPLKLPQFYPSPGEIPKRFSSNGPMGHRSDFTSWENSWSRLEGMTHFDEGILVSYNVANGVAKEHTSRVVVKVNLKSGQTDLFDIGDRLFVGTTGDTFYLFEDWNDSINADPTYHVHVYRWP